jgi:hypothetical protein
MGRWSASHWKTAVFGWLAFVVAAIAIGNAVGTKNISMQDANVGQSRKADQILSKGFPQADPQTELVCSCRARRAPSTIPRSERRSTTSPPPSRETRRSRTSNRLDPKNRDQVSNNRRTVIVTWNMKGKADVAKKKIDVGGLPAPELCCSCVSPSSPGQPSPWAPVPACLPAVRRRQSTWSATHPATPAASPGMTHRDGRNVRCRIKLPISPIICLYRLDRLSGYLGTDPPVMGAAGRRGGPAGSAAVGCLPRAGEATDRAWSGTPVWL